MNRELLERRKAELIQQRDAMIAQVHAANGAIAMLEELLNPPPALLPPPPAEKPPRTPKRKP